MHAHLHLFVPAFTVKLPYRQTTRDTLRTTRGRTLNCTLPSVAQFSMTTQAVNVSPKPSKSSRAFVPLPGDGFAPGRLTALQAIEKKQDPQKARLSAHWKN